MTIPVFPQLIGRSWSVYRKPMFTVQLRSGESQREASSINMTQCYYEFGLSYDLLRNQNGHTELTDIEGLFLKARGSYDYFLFMDPNDHSVINGGIGAGNGTNTVFILGRNTGPSYYEAVGHLNQINNIFLDGVAVDPADYSFSAPNIIVFNNPPGNGVLVTATFSYYYICRFGSDAQDYEQFMYNLYQLRDVTLKSVDY